MISAFKFQYISALAAVFMAAAAIYGQSASQEFPTPISANELSGSIKARDVGDSRLTTYYYVLNGEQGDLFVNLVTRNFTGDIDIFTINGLRPMTKIVVYADYSESETGRAIYLRKPEKLLLRIQGRSPNDDEATFRLKFAGSFVAMRSEDVPAGPEVPRVSQESVGGVRVNSVGTILPSPPKAAESEPSPTRSDTESALARLPEKDAPIEEKPSKPIEVENSAPKPAEKSVAAPTSSRRSSRNRPSARRPPLPDRPITEAPEKRADEKDVDDAGFRTLTDKRASRSAKEPAEPKADPLSSISLVIQFKDGNVMERKMSEVTRFSVDKGVLVVVLKTGGTTRYPIVDVAKVTIE